MPKIKTKLNKRWLQNLLQFSADQCALKIIVTDQGGVSFRGQRQRKMSSERSALRATFRDIHSDVFFQSASTACLKFYCDFAL